MSLNNCYSPCVLGLALRACLLSLLLALKPTAAAQVCSHADVTFYSTGNFKVRQVRMESPLDFMHALRSNLNNVKPQLSLQPGSIFTLEKSSEGRVIIENALDA